MARKPAPLDSLLGNAAAAETPAVTTPTEAQQPIPQQTPEATEARPVGRPRRKQEGNVTRCSFALDTDFHAELKVVLFRKKTSIQDVVEDFLRKYVEENKDLK